MLSPKVSVHFPIFDTKLLKFFQTFFSSKMMKMTMPGVFVSAALALYDVMCVCVCVLVFVCGDGGGGGADAAAAACH